MLRRIKTLTNHKAIETLEKLYVLAQFKLVDLANPLLDLLSPLKAQTKELVSLVMFSSTKAAVLRWARSFHYLTKHIHSQHPHQLYSEVGMFVGISHGFQTGGGLKISVWTRFFGSTSC